MASTRAILAGLQDNLKESIGVRVVDQQPKLSPVPYLKDAGRKPSRNLGTIEIERVVADSTQPRKSFDEEELHHLAKSIKTKQLAPIRVRWSEEIGKWIIVAGERRYRAATLARLEAIDCYFHDNELTASEILEEQMVENIQRQGLKPGEEAEGYSRLMEMNAWDGKQLAEALRISESKVSRALATLKHPDIHEAVKAGRLSASKAHQLSQLKNDQVRRELTQATLTDGLTHKQVKNAVRKRKGKPQKRPAKTSLRFQTESGGNVLVEGPTKWTYDDVEQTLLEVLEEVRHRLANNVGLY